MKLFTALLATALLIFTISIASAQEPDSTIFMPFASVVTSEPAIKNILRLEPDLTTSTRVGIASGILEWSYQPWDLYVILFQPVGSSDWCAINSINPWTGDVHADFLNRRSYLLSEYFYYTYALRELPCAEDGLTATTYNFALADNLHGRHTVISNIVTHDFTTFGTGAMGPEYVIETYPTEVSGGVTIRWRNTPRKRVKVNGVGILGPYNQDRAGVILGHTPGDVITIELLPVFVNDTDSYVTTVTVQ